MTIANIDSWTSLPKRFGLGLGLGGLLLAGCDPVEDPEEPNVAQPMATDDGATETEGEPPPPPDTDGDTDPADDGAEGQQPPEEPPADACSEQGASQACEAEGGEGTQFCDGGAWGPCLLHVACTPGESRGCCEGDDEGGEGSSTDDGGGGVCDASEYCDLYDGVPDWDSNRDFDAGCNTPLVLSFDGAPAELVPARAATFDLDGVGGCITTDWPAAATPWLALDVDGNGSIESGRELFGSGTRLRSGARAANGFAALAELDDDGDGRISASDEAFSRLVLWGDHDGDRRSTFAEAQPLASHHILGIELGYRIDRQCDARGNCGVERAAFHFIDEHGAVRQGEIVDLHLACQ